MKSLYLRIYLTVVAVLAAFALLAGWMAQNHVEGERSRAQQAWAERAAAWGSLLQNSLPEADAPREAQRAALLDWSSKLRLPLALDDIHGVRIAAAPQIEAALAARSGAQHAQQLPPGLVRLPLSDGRVLWVSRPGPPRLPPGPMDLQPPRGDRDVRDIPRGRGLRPGWFGPRPPWMIEGSGLVIALAVLFVAVAAGALPVVRRLTRRLEALQRAVTRFGEGELQHRVTVDGNDEVAAVARSFNHAAQRIEELVRAHRSLLANASHELRSPLARLKMALELIETAPPQRRGALREEIEHDIRELDELVEEVLLASRLDAHAETEAEPTDVLGLAVEEAARVGARLEIDPSVAGDEAAHPLRVLGSDRLLRRALRNLLENARRYGVPNGKSVDEAIELHVNRQGDEIEMRVCDRGPGVPVESRERIFEPFYRLPGHAEQAGGVGLGLSLVRQIAQRHGGSVHYEARAGGGSCFVLKVPAAGGTR